MSESLQSLNVEFDDEDVIEQPGELNEEGDDKPESSESAPDSGQPHEKKVEFSEDQQRVVDEIVGKKVYKLREKEREAEDLKKRLEELESKLPKEKRPEVPDLPDPYSLDEGQLKEALKRREDAIRQAAAYDAQQQYLQQQREELQRQQQLQQQQELIERADTYGKQAKKLGVKAEELQQAGQVVAQFISNDLGYYILQDDQGPLITKYLANNLTLLDEISRMHPALAAARIASEIKPKAAALKPKVTAAPDPLEPTRNANTAPRRRGPEGATYE